MPQATIYRYSDASAPALTGQTDTLNGVLNACLVTGYGAKAAAGWTRPFYDAPSDTGVYRPASGPRHYWQVADGGPGAGSFREARQRGYVTMSAFNTGTEPFPTVAQLTNGQFIRKSATLDGTARNWFLIADDKTCYMLIDAGDSNTGYQLYVFGEFRSWKNADAYDSVIQGRIVENVATITSTQTPQCFSGQPSTNVTAGYAPRSYTGLSGAVAINQKVNTILTSFQTEQLIGGNGQTYPYPIDGGILLSPIWLGELFLTRGEHRGLWAPCHQRPILQGDTFTATDGATVRTFEAFNILQTGQVLIETSNTWDAV